MKVSLRSGLADAVLGWLVAGSASGEWVEQRIELATRPGVTQVVYLAWPEGAAAATLVLFPGGDGKIRQWNPPNPAGSGNFLVRSRGLFVGQGFATAVVDAPSDQPDGMKGFVTSRERAADIAAVVAWLKQRAPAPVWLVGTSRGSISAAIAAAGGAAADGIVLTSSLTREAKWYPGTVYDAKLAAIGVPALVVNHKADGCPFSPAADGPHLLNSLKSAPRKELLLFEGGSAARSEPCEALAPHGYVGLEREVVERIAAWIRS
jgi:dienelactone hydrolase